MNLLENLGFGPFWDDCDIENDFIPARVVGHEHHTYQVQGTFGRLSATISGRFEFTVADEADYPCIGDFVMIRKIDTEKSIIERVLKRQSFLARHAATDSSKTMQLIATNVDLVLIVQSCNRDFNLRRMERYLLQARAGGATPIIVLNKADLTDSPEEFLEQIPREWETDVISLSALSGQGATEVLEKIATGITAVVVGSSGVGKSTLINRLLGEDAAKTSEIREQDARGRHTTTSKSFYQIEGGGMIIDTPGMREFGLIDSNISESILFEDIIALEKNCKYRNCSHEGEAGCSIQLAIESETLDNKRLDSFNKLKREEAYMNRGTDKLSKMKTKKKWKKFAKAIRTNTKINKRNWN